MKTIGSFGYIKTKVYRFEDERWRGTAVRMDGYHSASEHEHRIAFRGGVPHRIDCGDNDFVYFRSRNDTVRISRDDYNRLFKKCEQCHASGVVDGHSQRRNPAKLQIDVFINGVKVATKCRDFADEYPIEVLTEELANRLAAVVDEFCGEK